MADNVLSFQKHSMKYSTYFTKTKLMDYKTKNADTIFSPRWGGGGEVKQRGIFFFFPGDIFKGKGGGGGGLVDGLGRIWCQVVMEKSTARPAIWQ